MFQTAGNTFGTRFKVTTFGESHGAALGAVIDGVPPNIAINTDYIQSQVDKRKPNTTAGGTARSESDKVEIVSGVFEGMSTGAPIALLIRNENQRSADYAQLKDTFRPGHADYTFTKKYGTRDYRGGGRSSGRETVARVAAGAIAKLVLCSLSPFARITAYTKSICGVNITKVDLSQIECNPFRLPDEEVIPAVEQVIESARAKGDSVGGIVECIVKGLPAGVGDPVFNKLNAVLAHAIFSIGAVKGLEFGAGFDVASMTGSKNNDAMRSSGNNVEFLSNNAGGTLGGISTGEDIVFTVAIKPVPSISIEQQTIKQEGNIYKDTTLSVHGRHDVCLCPRVVSVVEAMTAIALCDLML